MTYNSTNGAYNSFYGFKILLKNNAARSMTVQFRSPPLIPDWTSNFSTSIRYLTNTGWPIPGNESPLTSKVDTGSITIAAFGSVKVSVPPEWRGWGSKTTSGSVTFGWTGLNLRGVYTNPIVYVEKNTLNYSVVGILNMYPQSTSITGSMSPAEVIIGEVNFTDAPSSGRISILANQDTTVQIKIDGVVVVSALELIKGYTAEWVTSTPGQYENNASVVVSKGIGTLATGKIVKDSDGNFNLEFIFDPDDALDSEEPLEMPDADATQVPGNVPDSNDSPTNVADGVTTPAQTGPDASAEPEGSTTKEMYDAVRAGVRDGMMADVNTGDPIDYKQPADTSGTDVGNAAEKVMTPLELPGGLAVPTIQSQALSIVLLGHTIAVPVPWWLAEWRGWFEFLIHVLGAMALFRLGKKAFA